MKPKKEIWIDEVLESMDGCERMQPAGDLFFRMQKKIGKEVLKTRTISLPATLAAAATILLLISLNFAIVKRSMGSKATETTIEQDNNPFSDYNTIPSDQLYTE